MSHSWGNCVTDYHTTYGPYNTYLLKVFEQLPLLRRLPSNTLEHYPWKTHHRNEAADTGKATHQLLSIQLPYCWLLLLLLLLLTTRSSWFHVVHQHILVDSVPRDVAQTVYSVPPVKAGYTDAVCQCHLKYSLLGLQDQKTLTSCVPAAPMTEDHSAYRMH